MTAILRNVPKTFSFDEQRVEINEIALDLYNLKLGTLELTDFSVVTGAAVSGGALSYDNTTGIFTFNPTDISSFLTSFTETDPIFVASPAYGITNTNIANWNNAHSWGDHSLEGYLKAADQSDWNATSGLAEILNKPTLFSGSYTDLTNKPTLFSGSYNDLTNKPTIPAAQVQADWNELDTADISYIQNKPTIPTVPTNVSAFNNDAGYLTSYNDTNTTYSLDSSNENVDDVKLTLVGSNSSTDSVVITKGNNITFSNVTTGGFTISATGGGGSGTVALDDLSDVTTGTVTTGDVLKYNGSVWEAQPDATGGGGGSGTVTSIATGTGLSGGTITTSGTISLDATLGQLSNVNTTGANVPSDGQVLKWNQSASAWQPANDLLTAAGGGGVTNFTGLNDTPNSLSSYKWVRVNIGATSLEYVDGKLEDLNDVAYTGLQQGGTPTTNEVLQWNGSNWTNATISVPSNVSDLTDVSNTSPNDGEALLWDAGNSLWVPGAVSGGGGSGATSLNGLTDVNAGSPTDGHVLKWDAGTSKWIAAADQTSTGNTGISLTDLSRTNASPAVVSKLEYDNTTGVFTYTPPDLSGYLTSYSETDSLSSVTGRGNSTTTSIIAGGNGSTSGVTISDGSVAIRTGTGNVAAIDLYCEVNNAHKVSIKAPLHADYTGDVNFVLPVSNGNNGDVLSTDGSGTTNWVDVSTSLNNVDLPDASGNFSTGQGYLTFGGDDDFYLYYDGTNDRAKITSTNKLDIQGTEIYLWDGTNTFLSCTSTTGDVTVNSGTFKIGSTNPIIAGFGNNEVATNTAFGVAALNANTATGNENTSIGYYSMTSNTDGKQNCSVGTSALGSNTVGEVNTTLGYAAAYTNVAGSRLTAIGAFSQRYADSTTTPTNKTNVSVGYSSLRGSTTASNNTGNDNTAIGTYSLESNTSGNGGVALGTGCLGKNSTADYNVAAGYYALYNATSGGGNVAVGRQSLYELVDGETNTAVGYRAAAKTTSGTGNVAIGFDPLYENVSGSTNIAIGYQCLGAATTVSNNIAIGTQALQDVTCGDNTAVGGYALRNLVGTGDANVTSGLNTALGYAAGNNTTNVQKNTLIGAYAGYFGFDGVNQTANPNYDNVTCLGYDSNCSGDDQVMLGENFTSTFAWGAVQNRSDERDKTDIRDTLLGLDFIKSLRPVDFRWDYREDYFDRDPETNEITAVTKDGSRKRNRYHHGLIAQEVKSASDSLSIDFAGYQDHKVNGGGDVLSIGYTELIAPMVKAMQELAAENAQLKARLDAAGL